jgi:hypothetical protein
LLKGGTSQSCLASSLCLYIRPPHLHWYMLTRPVVLTLIDPLQATRCSWATTWSPGRRRVKTSSPVRALRRSIVLWPMVWLRNGGFVSCLWSCTTPYRGPLWCTVTPSALSTSPSTPFSPNAPNMVRLIFTLSTSALPLGTFVFSVSWWLLSSLTSLPRGYPPRCFWSFCPVSTFAVARVLTVEGVREQIVLGAHDLHVLRGLCPLCGGRSNLLPINMYPCSLD